MALKQCCATGSLHTGTPEGEIKTVYGFETYVAGESITSPKGIIVIIPDAFGIALPNNRILADAYAKRTNSIVYLPDFMDGFVMPADVMISFKAMSAPGFWNQLYKIAHAAYLIRYFVPFLLYCRASVATPRVNTFFTALRTSHPNLPIGTAGFCWGGQFVTKLCWDATKTDDGKRLVDCGFVAHPSMLKYPEDIEGVVLPYSCAAAGIDQQMGPEQAKVTEEILVAKTAKVKDAGVEHEFVMYPQAQHGFAVRADENEKDQAEAGKKAEDQAVNWFNRWFASPPP